jgi:very-short-patch-repair endonuclease
MPETTPPTPLQAAVAVLAAQHAVASDLQLRRLGVTWKQQQTLLRRGVWRRHSPGVIADAGAPPTWHQGAMAVTLLPRSQAVLCGPSAARLHGLDGFGDIERLIIAIPNRGHVRAPAGVTVRSSRVLGPDDVETVDRIRTTTIAVTLVHLAMYEHDRRVQALDSALRSGEQPEALRAAFERWRRFGVHGPREMLGLLHERVGTRLPRSWFQRIAGTLLRDHGIRAVDEWPVRNQRNRLLAELDLAIVEWKVGIECQSWAWHGSPDAQRRDRDRKRMLRRLGWEIVEVWWSDLERFDEVVADVLDAIERARRLESAR